MDRSNHPAVIRKTERTRKVLALVRRASPAGGIRVVELAVKLSVTPDQVRLSLLDLRNAGKAAPDRHGGSLARWLLPADLERLQQRQAQAAAEREAQRRWRAERAAAIAKEEMDEELAAEAWANDTGTVWLDQDAAKNAPAPYTTPRPISSVFDVACGL